ncbi:MAG: oxidoreductase [Nocardioides sp.]|uniref:oxidoreductase n=1 Tax=Nocardioides sp. TaxID=35761 RepID=UPI0039E621F5
MDSRSDPLAALIALEGVGSAYAAARDGIDALLRDRGLRRTNPEVTVESLLRGAHASAVLEGSGSSLAEVREGGGDEIAAASLRVSTELLGLAPALSRTPLQVFARLHAVAAAGVLDVERLGRPRDEAAATRLRTVAEVLTGPTQAPALLIAAVLHAEVASGAPFASHNGLVARALERLVLVSRGVDEKSLTVPEAAHLALRPAYESQLRAYQDGGQAGVHSWLLYAAEAYARGAEESPVVAG